MQQALAANLAHPEKRVRQCACHQHEAGRAECLGLVDGAAIVLQRGTETRRIGCREEPAAAVAREHEAGVLQLPGDLCEACGLHLVAPRGQPADAASRAGLDDGGERELLAQRRRVDRQQR